MGLIVRTCSCKSIEKSHFFHGSGTTSRNSLGNFDEWLFPHAQMKGYAALRSWGTSVLWTSWCISSWLYTCSTSAEETCFSPAQHELQHTPYSYCVSDGHKNILGYCNKPIYERYLCWRLWYMFEFFLPATGALTSRESGNLRSLIRLTWAGCV